MAIKNPGLKPSTVAPAIDIQTMAGSQVTNSPLSYRIKWAVALLPFGYIWFHLINNLRLEWSTNPQYSYGWVVPFLCLTLLLRRWQAAPEVKNHTTELPARKLTILAFILLASLYLPTRLLEEATPEWRPIQFSFCIEAIGLTLCAIYLSLGRGRLMQTAFPICFFFVAVPWPTLIEQPVIQSLTRMNSSIVVELVGWVGVPALQHGNIIEVGTGSVGVTEACSGIRSFQTSLMLSLFFGEFFGLGIFRRLMLVPAGSILAMAFNVCRVFFLTMVAAKKGVAATAEYHDPAGLMITLVCTAGLWGLALLFKRFEPQLQSCQLTATTEDRPVNKLRFASSTFQRFGIALLLWLVAVEVGTELWYRGLESHLAKSPQWSVSFPSDNPTLQNLPISTDTAFLLRYDEGKEAAWIDPDGSKWEAFYCNWQPGRVAGYLAKRHTPEICLPASGWNLVSGPELTMMNIKGLSLPMRSYVWGANGVPIYVFHCRWEAGLNENAYVTHESARFNLIRGIWAGRGNHGQKILEIFVSGCSDLDLAKAALARHLEKMIVVEKS